MNLSTAGRAELAKTHPFSVSESDTRLACKLGADTHVTVKEALVSNPTIPTHHLTVFRQLHSTCDLLAACALANPNAFLDEDFWARCISLSRPSVEQQKALAANPSLPIKSMPTFVKLAMSGVVPVANPEPFSVKINPITAVRKACADNPNCHLASPFVRFTLFAEFPSSTGHRIDADSPPVLSLPEATKLRDRFCATGVGPAFLRHVNLGPDAWPEFFVSLRNTCDPRHLLENKHAPEAIKFTVALAAPRT